MPTVQEIFRAVQRENTSFSVARQLSALGKVRLNDKPVDLLDEVEIKEGDDFELGFLTDGEQRMRWCFERGEWRRKLYDRREARQVVVDAVKLGIQQQGESMPTDRYDGQEGIGVNEARVLLSDGKTLLIFLDAQSSPGRVDYVRFADAAAPHKERVYWTCDEWAESPAEVMGAIMACIQNGVDENFVKEVKPG